MDRFIASLAFTLLMLAAVPSYAQLGFEVAPSVGAATITNIDGYNDTTFIRVDGSFYPLPQLAANLFVIGYNDFETSSGNAVAISLRGGGAGVIGKWPVNAHFMPYARAEYFHWNAEATALNRTVGKDKGNSFGLALGAEFPIKKIFGAKAEVSGYNDVSGANIRQISVGMTLSF